MDNQTLKPIAVGLVWLACVAATVAMEVYGSGRIELWWGYLIIALIVITNLFWALRK